MTFRCRLATRAVLAVAGLAALALPSAVQAQDWAEASYRYRRPLVVQNTSGAALNTGDILAYSYIPDYGVFDRKGRTDGKDVKIVYFNGSTNVDIPQALLPMGISAAKVLFPLQAGIPAYQYLTVTDPAGKTDYSALPAGDKLTFDQVDYANDDATTVVTLPFAFPFKNGTSNQLRVGLDGYVVPGGELVKRYDIDDASAAAAKNVIMAWVTDLAALSSNEGVYYSADATQAVIRWEVQTSTGNEADPITARVALILKPNGEIRLVFGNPVTAYADYTKPKVGVGVGEPSQAKITSLDLGADYTNHNDILYTQNFNPPGSTGYWLYYGNTGDDGKAGRIALPPDKVVSYTFDDNTVQGWEGASGTAAELESLTAADGALVLDGLAGAHPVAIAKNQTAFLGDQVVYAKMRATGAREVAIMARADDSATGYGLFIDGFGEQGGILHRTATTYDPQGALTPYYADPAKWHFGILRITGQDADIRIAGRVFSEGQSDPTQWMYAFAPGEGKRINSGQLGITGWEGGNAKQYLDWVYVTSPTAESGSYAYGNEEVNTTLAVAQGKVTFNGVGLKDAVVTFTPTAGGAASSVNTDVAGNYITLVPAGAYTVKFDSLFPRVFIAQTKSATLSSSAPTTINAELLATDNLVENPSFEEIDPEFAGKPRGWFRRTYGGIADFAADGSDKNTEREPWIYSSTQARTGTRSVGFAGSTSNIQAWEVEGSAKTVNADNRGGAALPRVPQGATITYSFYYKKATGNGEVRHRPRYTNVDDVNMLIGGGASNTASAAAADWTKFEATYTNTDAATWTNPNYLAYRIYGVNNPVGEPVYVDDVVVRVTAIPQVASPKVYRGFVRDSQGNPLANVAVGLSDNAYNGLAAPVATAVTDGVGRFQFTVTDSTKTWWVQALKYSIVNQNNPLRGGSGGAVLTNYLASENVVLGDPAQDVVITYDPEPTINVAAGAGLAVIDENQPIGTAGRYAATGLGDPAILENTSRTVTTITDNDIATRVSFDGGDVVGGRKYPRFAVIDLGREYEFGTQIKQAQLRTDPAPVQGIQIRVSSTVPPATMTGYSQTSFTDAAGSPVLAWGKPVYISPNGTPINTPHPDPGDESRTFLDPANSNRVRTITKFLTDNGTPIKGRYVMLLIVNSKWNVSPVEFTLEAVNGSITGRVLDNVTGEPVADAFVGAHPNGISYSQTGADGSYNVSLPAVETVSLQAHKADSGTLVYPLTDPVSVTPAGGTTVTAPDIFLSAPVANLLIGSTAAQDYPGKGEEAPNVIGNIVDGDLSTRWVTQPLAANDVAPDLPLNVDIDAGTAKTINQIVLHWENANASQYSVLVGTTFDPDNNAASWTQVFDTTNGTGGYRANGTSRTVDAISFPARSVRYIRIVLSEEGRVSDRLSLWEVQAANAVAGAPGRADVVKIMSIVGGLRAATAADKTRLDVNANGVIDLADAAQLLKSL